MRPIVQHTLRVDLAQYALAFPILRKAHHAYEQPEFISEPAVQGVRNAVCLRLPGTYGDRIQRHR
ncbi:MAG: hypothetical protein B6D36_02590 [Planctomycetes bacterium UTPLA1]|nr:MAG: hypothetical protein B6D36_02590 [Planctomycetes bacterium UTPLA1]